MQSEPLLDAQGQDEFLLGNEPDARGCIPMPLKIAGNEISIIVALIVAINTPNVVLESATHLY